MSAAVIPLHAATRPRYQPTDVGNAERLVDRHGHDIRYIDALGGWHVWDDRRWVKDDTRQIERYAKQTIRAIHEEARDVTNDDYYMTLMKHAVASEHAARIKGMIDLARAEPGVTVRHDALDRDRFLLTVCNGTIDLRTGELRAHDRADLITKLAPVEYAELAPCPRWLEFLDRIFAGNEALIGYLRRAIGYALTGDVSEQVFHFLYGTGANGKSVFLETIAALLGDYAIQADFNTFLERRDTGPRNDVARLAGARLVRSSETGEGKRLDEALVKTLTGGERITARKLYAEAFEFDPTFKIFLAANHKPTIRGGDYAIWRRVRLVPFMVTIPPEERDGKLKDALRDELPGILNWALTGCAEWLASGMRPPDIVHAATEVYRAESDTIGTFVVECCDTEEEARLASGDLYRAYCAWCDDGGHYRKNSTAFGLALEERGFAKEKVGGVVYRNGLRLARKSYSNTVDHRA